MEIQTLGRYSLVEELPTASVTSRFFLAHDADDSPAGRQAAAPAGYLAKLLVPGRGPDAETLAAQFDHETKLLRAFNHPCIPTLHAAGEQDGVRYLVVDYVDGVDLAALLGHDRHEPRGLTKEIAVYVMGQLADALRHVHTLEAVSDAGEPVQLGVLHRDICPANVLLSRQGDVLMTDFGSATSAWLPSEHDMSQTGHKAYMAPERITGAGKATEQSDLFSMAVMLWEALRGERCFPGEDEVATMDAIVRFEITHSSRRVSGLSPKLSEIVRKNLDRDPARRYTGAYQMLQRLAQAPEAQAAEQSRLALGKLVAEVAGSGS